MTERDGLYCDAVSGGSSEEKFETFSFTGLLKERSSLEKSVIFWYSQLTGTVSDDKHGKESCTGKTTFCIPPHHFALHAICHHLLHHTTSIVSVTVSPLLLLVDCCSFYFFHSCHSCNCCHCFLHCVAAL